MAAVRTGASGDSNRKKNLHDDRKTGGFNALVKFCESAKCRHRSIAKYFGEVLSDAAWNCSSCDACTKRASVDKQLRKWKSSQSDKYAMRHQSEGFNQASTFDSRGKRRRPVEEGFVSDQTEDDDDDEDEDGGCVTIEALKRRKKNQAAQSGFGGESRVHSKVGRFHWALGSSLG